MSSSREEEMEELLRNRIRRQTRNLEQRRLLDVHVEFRQKLRLPIEAFEHLLEAVGPQVEHRTRRKRALTAQQQLYFHFLGTNSFYQVMPSCHGISTSSVWNIIDRVTPAILSLRQELIVGQSSRWESHQNSNDIAAGLPCVAVCVDGTPILVNPPAGGDA